MELHLSLLEKLIELPSQNIDELRFLLDDIGLEVKGVVEEGGKRVLTIETLANRADHTHHLGAAREISARTLASVKHPSISSQLTDRKASLPIRRATELCSRYALMEVSLPRDMKLRRDVAAIRGELPEGRHAVVELLNFIQLELGQPMHAFDASKLEGEVIIDESTQEETVEALDGKTYRVPPGSILIRDRKKILAVAGIIGCSNSMVVPGTTKALIESAAFDPVAVRKTRRAMGISTDASYLFERGSDIETVLLGLKRLAYLLDSTGGMVSGEDSAHVLGFSMSEGKQPEKRRLSLSFARIRKEFNLPRLEEVEVTARLKNLGYGIEPVPGGKEFKVSVPTWRLWDVHTEDDLVEDVARSYGLNRIKLVLPALDYEAAELHPLERLFTAMEPALVGSGFKEVITRGFTSEAEVSLIAGLAPALGAKHIKLKNAVEQSYSHMKVTNLLHLAKVCGENIRHGVSSVKIFEVARVFSTPEEGAENGELSYQYERDAVTLAVSGRWFSHEWKKPETREQIAAYFAGAIDSLFGALGSECIVAPSNNPLFHPGVQGTVRVGRITCGTFGLLHPRILKALDLKQDVFAAEFDAEALLRCIRPVAAKVPSEYPVIRRDITLKAPRREIAGRIERWVQETKPENLQSTGILDDFTREGEDFRRLTVRLTFQSTDRTLAHDEVDRAVEAVLVELKAKHSLELAS